MQTHQVDALLSLFCINKRKVSNRLLKSKLRISILTWLFKAGYLNEHSIIQLLIIVSLMTQGNEEEIVW